MPTSIPDLRQYLTAAYSDEELVTLCFEYFRDLYENFAAGMTKTQKILLLLDHCQRRELLPSLFAALERDRPEQYRRRFASIVAAPRPAAPPPGRDLRQVFVSHAHEDAEFAHRLAADLRAAGWRVWIAPDSIGPGEKWAEAINRGLEECGIFVVALTPAAVASGWVKTETNIAIELAQRREARFIPLSVADCRLPMLWTAFQRIPFAGRYAAGLTALLATLDGGQVSPSAPPAMLTLTSPIRLELVRIPAGEFLMGSDPAADKDAQDDEPPQHRVVLPDSEQIRLAETPRAAKELGHRADWPLRPDWEQVKDAVMFRGVLAKFEARGDLRELLLSTGDEEIVEDSRSDYYWGRGADGTGLNKFGVTLMAVRAALRGQTQGRAPTSDSC